MTLSSDKRSVRLYLVFSLSISKFVSMRHILASIRSIIKQPVIHVTVGLLSRGQQPPAVHINPVI